jgi:hypothetical protein
MIADLEPPFLAQVAVRGGIATLPVPPMKLYYSHTGSTYVKEVNGRRVIDKVMRGLEIRVSLFTTALVNSLDWKTRFSLAGQLVKSSLWSVGNFIRGKSAIAIAPKA